MNPSCSAHSDACNRLQQTVPASLTHLTNPDLIVQRSTLGNMALGCSLAVGVLLVLAAGCTTEALKTRAQLDKDFRVSALSDSQRHCSQSSSWKENAYTAMCMQSLLDIAPFGFGAGGHVELGITNFILWHKAGPGVPDPDDKRMGFFIAKSEAQTLLEADVAQVVSAVIHQHNDLFMTCRVIMNPLWRALHQNLTCRRTL